MPSKRRSTSIIQKEVGLKTYIFKAVIEEDPFDDGRMAYHVYCPALPHGYSWGYTQKEALENLRETVQLLLEDMLENGETFPEEPKEEVEVSLQPLIAVTV